MRLLWLTLADPEPPTNGQFIYSNGLIHGAVAAGATVHVVGLTRPESPSRDDGIAERLSWSLAKHDPRSPLRSLPSRMPIMAARTMTRDLRGRVAAAIDRPGWDAVVFDSLAPGWALSLVRRYGARAANRPRLVYIAHNHEANVARMLAADEPRRLRRIVKQADAVRVARLEHALVMAADLVTSNSPDDCALFRRVQPTVVFLPPGYDGPRTETRTITTATPRRALIVGSFDWSAKRQSLEQFLAVADRQFAAAGIELLIVGNAEAAYLARLRSGMRATQFTGRVDDVAPYFHQARLALVPDRLGGFKLKTLDYVFNRLPILAITGSAPGLPLRDGESIVLAEDPAALSRAVLALIDDIESLNRIQDTAYQACRNRFDWLSIGERLLAAIAKGTTLEGEAAPLAHAPG